MNCPHCHKAISLALPFAKVMLTELEAAWMLRCSTRSIRRYASQGKITKYRAGQKVMYSQLELVEFLGGDVTLADGGRVALQSTSRGS